MSSKGGNVEIGITADASEAKKSVNEVKSDVKDLDSTASETGDGAFSKLGSAASTVASTIAKTATAAVAALGAATLKIGSDALEAYADYEQLVGGVETLFGAGGMTLEEYAADVGASVAEVEAEYDSLMSAQETVLANAANAYQTAGMSANDYMETVTSFSASLISSLSGDTEAAAEVADTAITDMADNANKMGTGIEDIQNAYQGFAKQNYTMLDNLKLGYGGTQSEMERLIEDANELKEAQGEAGDLTIDSYADIVEAIHLVQDEMGITGTTALEASETISGSISSAKAAWENWLVGIADEDADMGELTTNLVTSLETAASNVLPRIAQIGEGLAAELPTAMASAIETLAPVVIEAVAGLWNTLSSTIGGALGFELPTIDSSQITEALQVAIDGVLGLVETMRPAVETIVNDLLPTVVDGVTNLVDAVSPFAETLVNDLLPVVVDGVSSAVDLLTPIIETVTGEIAPALMDAVNAVFEALTPVVDWLLSTVVPFISEAAETALPLLSDAVGLVSEVVQVLADTFTACWALIQPVLNKFLSIATSVFNGVVSLVRTVFNTLKTYLVSIVTSISSGIQSALKLVTGVVSGIQSTILGYFKGAGKWLYSAGKNILQGLANGIGGAMSAVIKKVTNVTSSIVNKVCKLLGINSPSKVFAEIGNFSMEGLAEGLADGASKALAEAEDVVSGLVGAFGGFDGVTVGANYAQTLQVVGASGASAGGTVINQTFETRVVRSDQDLYTAVPTIVRAALREANYTAS